MDEHLRIGGASEDDEGGDVRHGSLWPEVARVRQARRQRARNLAVVGALGLVVGGLASYVRGSVLDRRGPAPGSAPIPVAMAPSRAAGAAAIAGRLPAGPLAAGPAPLPAPPATDGPRVQVALLLDTSSSMDGLIDQARSQMWKVVNELAEARRQGERPQLELALYEYGHATLAAADNYVRQVIPFTTDLDRVSEQLFALGTNGGEEYCGAVIQSAARGLAWSDRPGDVRLVLIAGNEPFTQGPVPPALAIAEARRRGIVVNTILCESSLDPTWRDGAALAGGQFLTIDQNRAVAHVEAPQDAEIARLGALLNETYVPYGALGASSQACQAAQDSNAASVRQGAMLQRSLSKASASYRNESWDLVDATSKRAVDVAKLADADLPPAMRGLDAGGRAAYVEGKAGERREIQAHIARLSAERAAFVAADSRRRASAAGPSTLDVALVRVARAEAERKGFRFPGSGDPGPRTAM